MRRGWRAVMAALALWGGVGGISPAFAHKLHLFATVQPVAAGYQIAGSVYFSGGDRPAGAVVQAVTTTNGSVVASVPTEDGGRFVLTVPTSADYLLSTELDGHRAEWALPVTQFAGAVGSSPVTVAAREEAGQALSPQALAQVEAAVARQVVPLREQLDSFQQETRWRDVLGGLGWLVGLAGLWSLWGQRRR